MSSFPRKDSRIYVSDLIRSCGDCTHRFMCSIRESFRKFLDERHVKEVLETKSRYLSTDCKCVYYEKDKRVTLLD